MSTPSDAAGNTAACTLILPVTERLDPHTLQGAVDVLVRTAAPDLDLELLLAIGSIDDATRAAVQALSGDVRTVDGDATDAALATGSVVVAVVDATFRPDISDLAALVTRLGRSDDPLPFVHRLGLLVTTAERLRNAGPARGSHLLPELARRLHHDVEAPPQRPSIRQVQETAGTQRVPRPRGLDSRSVCVVVDGNASMVDLDACLTRLKRLTPAGVEMFVVDPGGDYQRSKALRAQRIARVLPGGDTAPLARVVRETTREIVVLLEAGTWVTRHWLDGLLDAFADDVVAVGPRTNLGLGHQRQPGVDYREVDEMEAMAARLRRPDDPAAPTHTDVPALSGVCLAVRRHALVAAGGPDEAFTDPELAGVDLCLRLRSFGRFVRADRVFVHVAVLPRGAATGRWRLGATGEHAQQRARHGIDPDRALPGLVTAVMIVKDEEEKIARAIESLSGLVDDVVVCDTGSSDGTVPLLEALGVRTTTFAWCDDFAAARNQALSQASSSWSLLLDADETLDCNDGAGWRLWLAENPTDVVFLVCRNLDSGTGGASVDNASARLLRTEDCHWAGRIHEQMVRRDGTQHLLSGTDLARILHDGYSVARIVERGKVARNANLTQLQLDDVGGMQANEPGRAHFERGRSELLAGNVSEAEQHFLVAIERLPANSELLRRIALCNLGVIANDCGRYEEG
ncbi:MAG: hypothetical protein QOC80_1595, partial [Frankiaceae bacterium]|nr:hypothetical protein [Frankiaceae bacterium]